MAGVSATLSELFKRYPYDKNQHKQRESYYEFIRDMHGGNLNTSNIGRQYRYWEQRNEQMSTPTTTIVTDKKFSEEVPLWDMLNPIKELQAAFRKESATQDVGSIDIKTDRPICIVLIADWHLGSWGTDYDLFRQFTEELINTPNLYAICAGDMLQMSIKLRGVLEVSDNALPPKYQMVILDKWLQMVHHKIIASCWDNHSVMREENASGFSMYSKIFSNHTMHSDHIAHIDLTVNGIPYNIAFSHFFRGRSMYNPNHGHQRYIKEYGDDRDIVMSGDSHTAGIHVIEIANRKRVMLNCGSIQNSGFGKRFFTLKNSPVFPCVVLGHKEKHMLPFWSVKEWLSLQP